MAVEKGACYFSLGISIFLVRQLNPLQHSIRGPFLASYFSHNSGESYQYVGGSSDTVPFKEAPSAVIGARHLIETRGAAALGKAHSFNELLSVVYLEAQSMAFHSDNEKGLGPVVAGLSLGSPAVMAFRLTAKPKDGPHRADLCLVLHHGDILVMEGTGVQQYYQHTVLLKSQVREYVPIKDLGEVSMLLGIEIIRDRKARHFPSASGVYHRPSPSLQPRDFESGLHAYGEAAPTHTWIESKEEIQESCPEFKEAEKGSLNALDKFVRKTPKTPINRAVRRARRAGSSGSVRRLTDPFRQGLEILSDGTVTGRLEEPTAVEMTAAPA
ncbi:2OG-Fe(II) oxygenase superfamily-domain-containing protein [Mycena leptocephala]|nr:2OG-Fe(II) oxygenase superfamily-domain-containing protein [Mycena leptocephala]